MLGPLLRMMFGDPSSFGPVTDVTFACARANGGTVNRLRSCGSLFAVCPLPGTASPRGALGACSLASSSRWLGAIMMSDAMVGVSSFAAFARNELLAERLVSESV